MTQEKRSISEINSHIEDYLDYYSRLSEPGFAVLLKGQWGCGKTWFVKKYCEKLKKDKKKYLYVSLYGMRSTTEIEDEFFRQLHPILASKGMKIAGKVFQGAFKAATKIDFNSDGKDDATVSLQIPDLDLTQSFKEADESILIFDDLERCQIDIGNVLGYINYFVEHLGMKVVIVANENKLTDNSSYKDTKEKLIGKTFDVHFDLHGALQDFISKIEKSNSELGQFFSSNTSLIEEIYQKGDYKNLRTLKQIIFDFKRIFEHLPEKAKDKPELLQEILSLMMVFSIEIKLGNLPPQDIGKLREIWFNELMKSKYSYPKITGNREQEKLDLDDSTKDDSKKNKLLKDIIDKYSPDLSITKTLPDLIWWQTFFDQGIIDSQELNQSILNSKYFKDENTPGWKKLLDYLSLDDDEYEKLLKQVEAEYSERKFIDVNIVKHITGLFLELSNNGIYPKSKREILNNAKLYIDWLITEKKRSINPRDRYLKSLISYDRGDKKGRFFLGKELQEFKDFCFYIQEATQLAFQESIPDLSSELLQIMKKDTEQFTRMIRLSYSYEQANDLAQIYREIPIFKHLQANEFADTLLSISFDNKRTCLEGIIERYKNEEYNHKLLEELDFLKDVQNLINREIISRKGKLSGYKLEIRDKQYLKNAIESLEKIKGNNEKTE